MSQSILLRAWVRGMFDTTIDRLFSRSNVITFIRGRRRPSRKSAAAESFEPRCMLSAIIVNSAADNTTADGLTTLREAIIQANANIGPDTITFVDGSPLGGTNFTDTVADTILLSLGEMEIHETLTVIGLDQARTIISGNNTSRILRVWDGALTLEKLTLTGGKTTVISQDGGAMLVHSDRVLTINDCTFSGNGTSGNGADGGAIAFEGSDAILNLNRSTFSNNSTSGQRARGGAIYFEFSDVNINNSVVADNFTTGLESRGGAIFGDGGSLTVNSSNLTGNRTSGERAYGGAISGTNQSFQKFFQCTIANNFTTGDGSEGGAIELQSVELVVSQSTFSGNFTSGQYSSGGAISTSLGGKATLTNSTLSGNRVEKGIVRGGGALASRHGNIVIRNCTITGNTAVSGGGGGLFISGVNDEHPLLIANSIVAGNIASGNSDFATLDTSSAGVTIKNSLFGSNSGISSVVPATTGSEPDVNGNFSGTALSPIDPRLGPLRNKGGTTETHELLSGSLAIDRGSNSFVPSDSFDLDNDLNINEPVPFDQRGVEFFRVFGTSVDIGAFERQAPALIVETNVDENDGNYEAGDMSLREAILLANQIPGPNIITFGNGAEFGGTNFTDEIPDTIALTLGTLSITDSVTISANSFAATIVDGQSLFRLLDVTSSDSNVALIRLNLRNGKTVGNGLTSEDATHRGGAIRWLSSGFLQITDCVLSGNSTAGDFSGGGAVFASQGTLQIRTSTFSGNSTLGNNSDGGAISALSGALYMTASTLSGNSTTGQSAEGGAVFTQQSVVQIVQSTITQNRADGSSGGGIYTPVSPLWISNSIIAGNIDNGSAPDLQSATAAGASVNVWHSLIGQNNGAGVTTTAAMTPDINGNLVGGLSFESRIKPHLGPLANNGGMTPTHALLYNSPALNRGSNLLAIDVTQAASPALVMDQRGAGFQRKVFGTVDMGAVEAQILIGTTGSDALTLTYSNTSITGTVRVSIAVNGGPTEVIGTFPMSVPLSIDALAGTDSIRVVGTTAADTFSATGAVLTINGATLYLKSIENRTLYGAAGADTYRFDADAALGVYVLHESGGATDTIDFSSTTTAGLNLNLSKVVLQTVHATNLKLILASATTFENITGGAGPDTFNGNARNNTLIGGAGHDKLTGSAGTDVLVGGLNDDTYFFGPSPSAEADQVHEMMNGGVDTLNFSAMTGSITVSLSTSGVQRVHGNRTLKLNSGATFENLIGGAGADTLTGNALNNRLTGGNGNNILVGLNGNDTLEAGTGRDMLIGGLGLDNLNGGNGDDILIAGRTTRDTNPGNLNALRTVWTSTRAYGLRISTIRAGVGKQLVSLKTRTNVLNDAGENDLLTGGAGLDWYFRAIDDVMKDFRAGEIADIL